jgi:hypothetical protein
MNAVNGMLTSRRVNRWLPWISAAVLVAGVVTFMAVRNTGRPVAQANKFQRGTAPNPNVKLKTVPLSTHQREIAGRFILTAVKRKNLAEAYKLVGPGIKQGMTLKQWMGGNIAVTPYLPKIDVVTVHPEYSVKTEAILKIIIVPKGNGRASTFLLTLDRFGSRWLVNDWQPTGRMDIPLGG